MKRVSAQVWYDISGQIIAVGYVPQSSGKGAAAERRRRTVPLAGGEQFILDVEMPEEALDRLHETHRIDVSKRSLVAYEGAEPKAD